MVLKKIKQTLLIFAIAGALLVGGFKAYCVIADDLASSKIVEQLGGE